MKKAPAVSIKYFLTKHVYTLFASVNDGNQLVLRSWTLLSSVFTKTQVNPSYQIMFNVVIVSIK